MGLAVIDNLGQLGQLRLGDKDTRQGCAVGQQGGWPHYVNNNGEVTNLTNLLQSRRFLGGQPLVAVIDKGDMEFPIRGSHFAGDGRIRGQKAGEEIQPSPETAELRRVRCHSR